MLRHRVLGPAVALLAGLMLAACVPGGGVATPTPTELTDEQAYEAAEDAFRAYIDAQNQVDPGDTATFERVFQLTTGRQNALERTEYSVWHAEGYTRLGAIEILWISRESVSDNGFAVRLRSCLDSTSVQLLDEAGTSQKSDDSEPITEWVAGIVRDDSDGRWRVEATGLAEGASPCSPRP